MDTALAFHRLCKSGATFVPTVHHTGTWFVLEFLLWHSHHVRVVEFRQLLNGEVPKLFPSDIVHLHIVGLNEVSSRGDIDRFEAPMLFKAVKKCRSIIPLRDPLKALLSREERHPGWDHRFIVDGFCRLPSLKPRVWFPVDLPYSHPERLALLRDTLKLLGLPVQPYIHRYAREWKPVNTRHQYRLKSLYEQGDLQAIRNQMPINYDHLQAHSSRFLALLREHGYGTFPWEAK